MPVGHGEKDFIHQPLGKGEATSHLTTGAGPSMSAGHGHQKFMGALGAANPSEARSRIATGQQVIEYLLNHRSPTTEGTLEELVIEANEVLCPVLDDLIQGTLCGVARTILHLLLVGE